MNHELGHDFNLTPILAEACFNQVQEYFLAHGQIDLATGQLHYLAIDENEPAGKPVALCKKISVKLSLHQVEEDLAVYRKSGLRALRQHRIVRITNEAIEQGGVLSYEDIAFMLTTSVVTVKRDMSHMRRRGIILPSRGWRQEMGRRQTHKTQILDLYLSGHQFSSFEQRTRHSEGAIRRYIQDFARVVLLHKKSFSVDQIRITTGFSHRLIGEYLKLAKRHSDSPHLKRILQLSKKKGANSMTRHLLPFVPRDTREYSAKSSPKPLHGQLVPQSRSARLACCPSQRVSQARKVDGSDQTHAGGPRHDYRS